MNRKIKKVSWRLVVSYTIFTLVFWGMGGIPFNVKAASLQEVKDTITDSDLSVLSNHTIQFKASAAVPAEGQIVIDFPAGFNIAGSFDYTDVDFATSTASTGPWTDRPLATATSTEDDAVAVVTGDGGDVTITMNSTYGLAANTYVQLEFGTNATSGDQQITNPGVQQSYTITVTTKNAGGTTLNTGKAMVAIVNDVTVTASVGASFTFTVTGKSSATAVRDESTGITTTAETVPFGTLTANTPVLGAQELAVATNAKNGFVVSVFQDQNLTGNTGADIDAFKDGAAQTVPAVWAAPAGTLDSENTYGHMGFTSTDDIGTNKFLSGSSNKYAGFDGTTAYDVFSHSGPADGATLQKGKALVAYKIEISALQEADDYTNTLTYVATPTF